MTPSTPPPPPPGYEPTAPDLDAPDDQGGHAGGGGVAAPPRRDLGAAGRVAAGVSSKGVGVDPDGQGTANAGLRLGALLAALALLGWWSAWALVVVLAILLMIFLHELGHYVMAKRAGMKVTEFFIGFGPRIWSTRRGETEYGIKAIPAGAYVKIIGMSNLDEVDPADEPRTYRQKSFPQRIGVAVAGSAMHFLLALVLIFVALVAVGQPAGSIDPRVAQREWRIDSVTPGSGADRAGLEAGDRIVSVDGKQIRTFEDIRPSTNDLAGETVPLVYERDGRRRTTTITIRPFYNWGIDQVVDGSAVAEAGLELGDEVISIDGEEILFTSPEELDVRLRELEGQTVPIVFERYDVDTDRSQRGQGEIEVDRLLLGASTGYVGIGAERPEREKLGVVEGLVATPREFVRVTGFTLSSLGRFFTPGGIKDFAGQVGGAREDSEEAKDTGVPTTERSAAFESKGRAQPSENRMMSIYGLVRVGSDIGAADAVALVSLFALINIFIGVFNLVPLLPFDGGHVAVAVYERIQERRLRRRRYFTDFAKLLPVVYPVVALLALLFISTLYLDIVNPLAT